MIFMIFSILQVGPSDCLKEVALKILRNKVATVPVIYSTAQGGSNQQLLLHLASLSEILKCKLFLYSLFKGL